MTRVLLDLAVIATAVCILHEARDARRRADQELALCRVTLQHAVRVRDDARALAEEHTLS